MLRVGQDLPPLSEQRNYGGDLLLAGKHDEGIRKPPSHGPIRVASVFFQEFDGVSIPPPEHPVQHAYGKKALQERLGKCTFQISPGAFFQVNTQCAEVLYGLVVDQIRAWVESKTSTAVTTTTTKQAVESESKPEATTGANADKNTDGAADSNNNNNQNDKKVKRPHVTLLDVCCGTGTIGLTCMKEGVVDRVVGVDISEPAIADAKINARLNGYGKAGDDDAENSNTDDVDDSKTRFVASRAELVMSQELQRIRVQHNRDATTDHAVVAVVDPAREGLHMDVCRAIRMQDKLIERLVYVSCNPTGSLVRDAANLCAPPTKRYPGRAFKITSAQPVDMFPLTDHCEMVMVFDRCTEADMSGS